jgi:hypothetical protein
MFSHAISETPNLIEPSAKNYLFQTLQQCHKNRVSIYYYTLNIGVFLLFVGITAFLLYSCSQKKVSDYERRQNMLRDQEYVLSKIRFYQDLQKKRAQTEGTGITDLPFTTTVS